MLRLTKICCALALGIASGVNAQQARSCRATDADKPAVAETVRAMYAVIKKGDLAGYDAMLAPGFYMYDGGKRWDGDSAMKVMLDIYKKGYSYEWTLQEPMVEVDCNMAFVAYEVKGVVTNPDGTKQDRAWLESGLMEKHDGRWLLKFFHSTREVQ